MDLDLTDKDRLFLANQFDILANTEKAEGQAEAYGKLAKLLRDGQKWLYSSQLQPYLSPNFGEGEFVVTILGIYSDLKASWEQLADKSGIEHHDVSFPGFDGNNETDYLSFANALFENGLFSETLKSVGLNSHIPVIDGYLRMIAAWGALGTPRYPMTKEQIQGILQSRRYQN